MSSADNISKALFSGTISGAASVVAGHPLETIKTRMQTNPQRFGTIARTIMSTIREERITTLYKGVTPALTSAIIENAVVFAANKKIENMYTKIVDRKIISNSESAIIGGFAGIFSAIAISPPEMIKVRMQADAIRDDGKRLYKGNLDCFAKTLSENGIRGLFRSLPAQLARDIPFNFVFFGSYATLVNGFIEYRQVPSKDLLTPIDLIFSGGLAGVIGWTFTIPMDVIKSKVSCLPKSNNLVLNATKTVFREEGFKGFFKGWTAVALRSFPSNGALFWAYEMSQQYLNQSSIL